MAANLPPATPAATPYTIGAIEGAVVAFVGSFAGALLVAGATLTGSLEAAIIPALGFLGYHAYQSS